jgi:hypothetical protein
MLTHMELTMTEDDAIVYTMLPTCMELLVKKKKPVHIWQMLLWRRGVDKQYTTLQQSTMNIQVSFLVLDGTVPSFVISLIFTGLWTFALHYTTTYVYNIGNAGICPCLQPFSHLYVYLLLDIILYYVCRARPGRDVWP